MFASFIHATPSHHFPSRRHRHPSRLRFLTPGFAAPFLSYQYRYSLVVIIRRIGFLDPRIISSLRTHAVELRKVLFLAATVCGLFMVALWNRADHYIFILFLLLLLFSSPNLSGRRFDVHHTSAHGVALVRS